MMMMMMMMMLGEMPVQSIITAHLSRFTRQASPIALPELQRLIAHIFDKPRTWVLAHPEATLTPGQQAALNIAIERLQSGEPLPYILGHWEFYGLDFMLTPDVLIPRPETELLVEHALAWLRPRPQSRVLDVGTGSGCIATSLAIHASQALITASDISPAALKVARANAQKHAVADKIQFLQTDLLDFHPATFNLIVANLPYIPTATLQKLEVYGKEPTLALNGGCDGLDLIRRLLESAPPILTKPGCMLLEIEANQGAVTSRLACQHFPHAEIRILPDLAGRDRLLSLWV